MESATCRGKLAVQRVDRYVEMKGSPHWVVGPLRKIEWLPTYRTLARL